MKIDKKGLEKLAELAKIEIKDAEGLASSMQDILNYMEELNSIDTADVEGVSGGTSEKNVSRKDQKRGTEAEKENSLESKAIRDNFPEEKDGYLRVPAVFE